MAETLGEKQRRFVRLVGRLIEFSYQQGYELSAGEFYRTPEQASLNAQKGSGITNSLHTKRLAVDFQLFRNGGYLTKTEDYAQLGEFWESLGEGCSWGGRFTRADGNHFSILHDGVR